MTTDRELLELAAKAAGVEVEFDADNDPHIDEPIGGFSGLWNPLHDDGDALRLAVRLGIEVMPDLQVNEVLTAFMVGRVGENTVEEFKDDPMQATRRAIVIAAARIGEKME